jgi:hypothetical protein
MPSSHDQHEQWHVNEIVERISALMHDSLQRFTHHLEGRISHMNQQLQAAIDGVKASVDTASATASAESADISTKVGAVIAALPPGGATAEEVAAAVAQLQAIQQQTDALTTAIGNLSDAVVAPVSSNEPTG